MDVKSWTYLFVGLSFSLYLLIAWLSRVRDTRGFYVAGRGVPAIANGMATGADWMSAASFISMAGLVSTMGYAGGVYLMGWTGGYVLLALLLAPYLRKFGHFTVPDFVGDRYQLSFGAPRPVEQQGVMYRVLRNPARLVAVVCAIFVSFTYVAGQMRGVGVVFARFLEVDINVGVVIGMAIVFIYATLGGMKGITWTQVAQYWVLITAFLVPAIAISIKLTGNPVPQLGLTGELTNSGVHLLDKLNAIHADLGFSSYTEPFQPDSQWSKANVFCVALALMAGTAGLPHVIVRFYTVKNVRAARWSAFWALFFIALLYLTAPATAAFARYYMLQTLNGRAYHVQLDESRVAEDQGDKVILDDNSVVYRIERDGATLYSELPHWFFNWQQTGLILWLDGPDDDGLVRYSKGADNEIFRSGNLSADEIGTIRADHERWLSTAGEEGADGRANLNGKELAGPDNDIIVLATPEMAELSSWIIALVAAGGLAAALSTASGLLLVISSSVAHDLYARVINPEAPEARRLLVGRVVIGLAVVIAGIFGIYPPGFVSQVVAFAFGLAAASFFPTIVLGIFTKRVSTVPAVLGMISGISFTGFYIVAVIWGGMATWTFFIFDKGINPQGIGTIGMLINFAVTLALTPLFPPPSQEVQDMVESIREPEGEGPAVEIETAPEH